MSIGFIGLGSLGSAMVRRLIDQGEEMIVWNRTGAKARGLKAEVADSPADLISRVDLAVLNLFDSKAVADVLTGDSGLLAGDCTGKLVIDTTTNHFDSVAEFHASVGKHGGDYLEAPVVGSVVPASEGALTILVSGKQTAFDRAEPYLRKLGKHLFFLGQPGLASKVKVINNLVLGSFMATIAEAVAFGEAAGVARERMLDMLAVGAGNSGVLNAKRQKLLGDNVSVHFSSSAIYKDLHYMQDLARDLKRPLFTGSIVKELFAMAIDAGLGQVDFSGVYRILARTQ